MPQPGDVFREYTRVNSEFTLKDFRVTDPNATFPTAADFLPNPVLPLQVSDLQGATRAELVIDFWGGHPGTQPRQFRFNTNAWITIPNLATTPSSPNCYMQQVNFVVDVPLAHLVQGNNSLEGTSGGQVCLNFGWGQWGWYQVALRVYYNPATKPHPTGSITSPATGSVFGENPTVAAVASGGAGVTQVDFFAYFDGYDPDGDGRYADWQVSYHRPTSVSVWSKSEHVGSTFGPHSLVWDTSMVPDQPVNGVKLIAHIRDANGYVFVTDEVSSLTFQRSAGSVKIYRAFNVPQSFWVRNFDTKTCNFTIPAGDNLTNASSAWLLIRSWNGLQEPTTTKVNDWVSPLYGHDHFYSYSKIGMPPSALKSGLNKFTASSTETAHHGTELMWPGPAILVRYNTPGPGGPPQIVTQPTNVVVTPPAPATFAVAAIGTAPLSYQWRRGGMPIAGATGSSYVITPAGADNGAQFSVVVNNAQGSVTSLVATLTVSGGNWWNTQWRYRAPIVVNVGPYPRTDKPVNVPLNFTQLLAPLGGGAMNDASIRVIETNGTGTIVDASVPFQFDRDAAYNANNNARGTLIFLLTGNTAGNATRNFHVYFDTGSGFSSAAIPTQVSITDGVAHEGQSSYRITTPTGTYYYHKQGAGFASLEDVNGNDWINYHPGGGSAGEFRGIPNLGDVAHPGYLNSTSSILNQGPLKATIQSQSLNGTWKLTWEIYPTYATMTLLQAGTNYWLSYEGTPGGTFEPATDYFTRSSGETLAANQVWVGDIPGPEWVYFGDGVLSRILFLAHHEDDAASDQYWQLDNNMTIFGFGRQYPCCGRYLTAVPAHLTIGFGTSAATASTTINSAFRDLTATPGAAESAPVGGPGSVSVAVAGPGSVLRNPDQANYALGEVVQLTAVPTNGSVFAGWSGSGLSGSINPINLTIASNHLLTATFTTPLVPQIVTQPANAAVLSPNPASFSVVASGAAPLSYQWRRGGMPIAGATAASYNFSPTSIAGDNGAQFSVVVNNSHGSVTSVVAALTVVNPASLPTSGLGLWLRADQGSVLNGSTVSQWNDQSGNNSHATQVTPGRQPLLQGTAVNGMPVLRFDGVDDSLSFNFPVNGLSAMTLFVVSANTQNQTNGQSQAERAALFWNETAAWGTVHITPLQSKVLARFGTGQSGNFLSFDRPASIGNAFSLTASMKNGMTDTLFVNGTQVLSQNGKLAVVAECQATGNLGRGYNDDTFFAGDIAEVLVYTQALNPAQRQLVEQHLAAKYGLPISFPPVTLTPPANLTVQEPNPAGFTAVAGGSTPLAYQWRRAGTPISGATSSTYMLGSTSVASDNGAQFDVIVSNTSGSVTSSVATLTVTAPAPTPPSIQTQPVSLSVIEPSTASFSVVAAGSPPLAYQWRRGGAPISGATSASYQLTSTSQAADNGAQFDVIASNASGSVTSSVATLTVLVSTGLPANGLALWLRADLGAGGPAQWTDQSGNNRHATQPTTVNQPTLVPALLNGLPALRFDGVNDFLNFSLPINGLNGMTILMVAANSQNQTPGPSQGEQAALFWNETAAWGTAYLTPFQSAVAFRFGTTQSGNRIIYNRPSSAGTGFTLSTAVKNGTTDALYVNRTLAVSQSGKLATIAGCMATANLGRGYNEDSFFAGHIAEVLIYTRALSDIERQTVEQYLDSKYQLTQVTPTKPLITQQPLDTTVIQSNAANFSVTASGTAPLSYQWRRAGAPISGATSSTYMLGSTSVASDSGAQFDVIVSNASGSVTSSVATLTVTAPAPTPPSIQTQPVSLSVIEPNTASFSVVAGGSTPLSYQWRRGGASISGATSTSYQLTSTSQAADNGAQFDVVVTNASGSVTSSVATLTVAVPTGLPANGLALWLRADLGAGGPAQWTDQSGNNRHATQPTTVNQPTLVPALLNGLPALRFDGVNDFLNFNLPINGLSGMTILMIAANSQNQTPGPSQGEQAALFWNETAAWGTAYLTPFQSSVAFRFGTTQSGNRIVYNRPSSAGTGFTLSTAVKNGTTDALYVNRTLAVSQSGKLSTIAGCMATANLGRGYNDDSFFAGHIAEVMIYTRALTDIERQTVEQYLDSKYQLTQVTPTKPLITQQPLDTTVIQSNAANFSVTTSGTAPLAYQWRRAGTPISGATSSTYMLSSTSVASDNGAQFDVIVSNASGSVTSSVATLTVIVPAGLPSDGLALWLRADQGAGSPAQWTDQSGNGRHATQLTTAHQPTLTPNAVNGLPALSFDGLNDFLTLDLPVNGLTGLSLFLVAANTQNQNGGNTQAERAALFWNETGFWGTLYLSPFQSAVNFRFGTTQAGNRTVYTRATSVGSGFTLTAAVKNGANEALYLNGNLALTQGGKLLTIAGCQSTAQLGRGYDNDTYFAGQIAEVLAYNRALSNAERQAVEQYLLGKYALTPGGGGGVEATSSAVLELTVQPEVSGTLRVLVAGPAGVAFVLERSTNLREWTIATTETLSANGTAVWIEPGTGQGWFFRARLE